MYNFLLSYVGQCCQTLWMTLKCKIQILKAMKQSSTLSMFSSPNLPLECHWVSPPSALSEYSLSPLSSLTLSLCPSLSLCLPLTLSLSHTEVYALW